MERRASNCSALEGHVPRECSCMGAVIFLCTQTLRTRAERCFSLAYGNIVDAVANERWSSLTAELESSSL